MTLKTKIAAISTLLMFQNFGVGNSAAIDSELAVIAAEQDKTTEKVETFDPDSLNGDKNKTKTKDEIKAEEKRLEDERKAAKKKIKDERKKSRDELNGKKPVSKNPAPPVRKNNNSSLQKKNNPQVEEIKPVETVKPVQVVEEIANIEENIEESKSIGMPNPIRNYATFNEVVQAVNFTPLYIPKKFGYTITSFSSIENHTAEIRYSRKWEPSVVLHIRTYKRAVGENLKDISGVHGVKWRVNTAEGITTYIANINEKTHVAAWAVGNYTFSAYVENIHCI